VFLGLDLGTSSVKALLVDGEQRVLASATRGLGIARPAPGHSEQNPEAWWDALLAAVDALRRERPRELAALRGIGLSGQMHGAVLLDRAGAVLRPAILWNDTRATAECRELEQAFPQSRAVTGNIAMPGFTAPKLLWVRRHEPAIFGQIAHVLLPKAWLRYRLTGERIEDMSDASGTLWLDVGARDWSDRALAACGLGRESMPRLVEGSAPAGTLRAGLAARWGIDRPPVLAGGAGDNAAGAVVLFFGVVRNNNLGRRVEYLEYDAYPPLAERMLAAIADEVRARWEVTGVAIHHRTGRLTIGEASLLVAISSPISSLRVVKAVNLASRSAKTPLSVLDSAQVEMIKLFRPSSPTGASICL